MSHPYILQSIIFNITHYSTVACYTPFDLKILQRVVFPVTLSKGFGKFWKNQGNKYVRKNNLLL